MRTLVHVHLESLAEVVDAFPWEMTSAYADWLAQTYYYVRHSTRLLATAAGRFELDERGAALHRRFSEHMNEEKRHELLAAHDLKVLGSTVADHAELPATRMFYEPQYYKIEHQHPVVLFGYILALEAAGPRFGRRIADRVAKVMGERCLSFLRLHTEEDEDHIDKALAMVEMTPASERAHIEANLVQTLYGYGSILGQVQARHPR